MASPWLRREDRDGCITALQLNGVETRLIEFKTHRHGQEQIHSFTPLTHKTEEGGPGRSWEETLRWADPEARSLAGELTRQIERLPDVAHKPKGRFYYFYRAHRPFCVLILQKRGVHLRLITDPHHFQDPRKATREYRGWFWSRAKGRERGLTVVSKDELEYALALMRQAYEGVAEPH